MSKPKPAEQPARKPQRNFTATAEELALLERLAKHQGLTVSGLIRLLVLTEARRLGVE